MSADDGEATEGHGPTTATDDGLPPLVRGLIGLLLLTVAAVFGVDLVEFAAQL